MSTAQRDWTHETDIVVVGTGGAGLTAAIAAHDAGASVIVLEKSGLVGGTTAVSGGVIWVPDNASMKAKGLADSRDEARDYMLRIADGRSSRELTERYLDAANEMVAYLEAKTDLRFESLTDYPDYHPEFPGGRSGGRPLDNGLFDTHELGVWEPKLRRNPISGKSPMTIGEAMGWGVFSNPMGYDHKRVYERYKQGIVSGGTSLMGKLLKACLARGIEPMLETPGRELVLDESGAAIGIVCAGVAIRARKGVILASGGFEWDEELRKAFLPLELTHPLSPPSCDGDGLKMAMSAGAALGNMGEAWWTPAIAVPGEQREGKPLYRGEFSVRCLPHSIIVNRYGKRFTTESHNYNDMTKPFFHHDPFNYDRVNVPAWLIVDQAYRDKYALVTVPPGKDAGADEKTAWIRRADTLDALAEAIGVAKDGLRETVARFNRFAESGVDEDFHRGESAFDRYYGDRSHGGPNPNLGTIAKAPFYAVEIHPGAMGTKGGPKVDVDGRVLHVNGKPIAGLYAAGNVMSAVAGHGYAGPGITICTAMTWGYLAARHAAGRA